MGAYVGVADGLCVEAGFKVGKKVGAKVLI